MGCGTGRNHPLKDVHKEMLYYSAIRQYSNQRIACIRKQKDRNILKAKNTILEKLRMKLYAALYGRQKMKHPLSRREKVLLENYSFIFAITNWKKLIRQGENKEKNEIAIDGIQLACYDSNIFI